MHKWLSVCIVAFVVMVVGFCNWNFYGYTVKFILNCNYNHNVRAQHPVLTSKKKNKKNPTWSDNKNFTLCRFGLPIEWN